MSGRTVIVVEDPADLAATAHRLREEGWPVQTGWQLAVEPWDQSGERLLCSGAVPDERAARAALVAAVRTSGVVVAVTLPEPHRGRFVRDLDRLGPVEVVRATKPTEDLPLTPEQLELLGLVADGRSVPEAAADLYLSQRTAERRLALARKALGVRSTPEAIARLLAHRRTGAEWR